MVRHGWPYFGLTTTLNAAAYCASMSTVSAGQHRNGQVADERDTVYGSDSRRPEELGFHQIEFLTSQQALFQHVG